jgi:hypothetical protein
MQQEIGLRRRVLVWLIDEGKLRSLKGGGFVDAWR